jgi:hypothetical protein
MTSLGQPPVAYRPGLIVAHLRSEGVTHMTRKSKILTSLVVIVLGAAAALLLSGRAVLAAAWFFRPWHDWDLARMAPAPDYARADSWAARPGKDSLALLAPRGTTNLPGTHGVDVFFVHPTGFISGKEWNSPLDPNSRTEENTEWMMANQASVFSGCCNIYAPRYREASIFRYITATPDIARKSMDFAYADVERAFQYFLEHDNQDRPFIIASHSQGTAHAFRLIREHIDGTPLASRMIAAYLIGAGRDVTNAAAATLKTIRVCNGPTETGCLVHWATYRDGSELDDPRADDMVCVNPLSWKRNGGYAAAGLHLGGVPATGKFSVKFWGDDSAQGVVFAPLGTPIPHETWAACEHGQLMVADQSHTAFRGFEIGKTGNYHGLDYPLFYMDIRENAGARIAAYMQSAGTDQGRDAR